MNIWQILERPAAGPPLVDFYAGKVEALRQGGGNLGLLPTDLVVLVYGLALAWFSSPKDLLAADGSDPGSAKRLATHRSVLVEAARRLVTPGCEDEPGVVQQGREPTRDPAR